MSFQKNLYFIAIVPPEKIQGIVNSIKIDFELNYNSSHALKSPPHITLIPPFYLNNEEEPVVFELIKKISEGIQPFSISLKGFGAFQAKVIYIKVVHNSKLIELLEVTKNKLMGHINTLKSGSQTEKYVPHMTIAFRDLSAEKFKEAWQKYRHEPFNLDFKATEIVLLKHNGKKWSVIQDA